MGDFYAPVSKAAAMTRTWIEPGRYTLKFICSEKGVKEDGDLGVDFSPSVTIDGKDIQFYERFRVPRDEREADALSNRTSEDGRVYVDPNYKKFLELQKLTGVEITEMNDVFRMFENANVSWGVILEMKASSDKTENYKDLVEYIEENVQKGWRESDYNGATYFTWRIYQLNEEVSPVFTKVETWGGVTVRNILNGYTKPEPAK